MNFDWRARNIPLDAGVFILALGILSGLAILVFGQAAGQAQQSKQHAEQPPSGGEVPNERHQNISGVASR